MALQTMHHPAQHQHHHRSRPTSILPPTSFHAHTASDSMSARSSSETTAAGIFSMYEDPGTPPPNSKAPPVPALDPRLRYTQTSSRPVSTASRPSVEAEYRVRSGSRALSEMSGGDGYEGVGRQRPRRSAEMGSPVKGGAGSPAKGGAGPPVSYAGYGDGRRSTASRRSYTLDGRSSTAYDGLPNNRSSIAQPTTTYTTALPSNLGQESTYPARRSSLQHITDSLGTDGQLNTPSRAALKPLPPSRTPSPRIAMLPPSSSQVEQISITIPQSTSGRGGGSVGGSAVSQHSNPSADLLTPIGDRERRTSSKHSMQTTQTTQTSHTEYTTRGSTEDVDAYRVRATYAKLEAEGVYGDGWMEGVERTRTRIMSAGSVALLEASKGAGGKGADVGKDEEARLRSTDRYGFFNTPTPKHEGRLALLPTAAFRQLPSTSKQPPIPPPPNGIPPLPQITHVPSPSTDPRENYRISKWERMLVPASSPGSGGSASGLGGGSAGWRWDTRKVKKRTERVFKGIPDRWRSAAWGTLVEERMVRPSERRMERVGVGELGRRYRDLLDQPSEHDVQIDLDVPRTISGHVMFHTRYGQGQRSLFYVLHAFSLLCPSCGYVQGMGPIAATLLNYFEPERTYAALVRLHDEYAMHTIFQPGFPGLLESIYVQERLVERTMPGVYQALSKNMISSTSFVTKWYITLFANTVPFQTQLRLWDAFLLEGRDVLVVTAVAILWVVKDQISAAQANFETILSLLSSTFVIEDEDAMMHWMERILGDRKVREEMDGWRADWGRLVAEGKSGTALL